MKPVQFHVDAAQESRDAAAYYTAIRKNLGLAFKLELDAAIARIRQNPQLYPLELGAVRICPLHRFPYSILFEELGDRIWIAAVAHHSRRPHYWSRRHLR